MAEKKLLQLLDSISIDKNTNLLPTTLKDGVTCLGVEGDVAPLSITADATAVANDLAIGKTAYINNEKVEGTLFESTDEVVELGLTSDISIGNVASDGVNTVEVKKLIKHDMILRTGQDAGISIVGSDLAETLEITSEKLLEGNTILGVVGTAKSLDITNDATAEAEDIVMGKSAYVNGEKIEGTAFEIPEDGIYQEKWNEEITVEDSATGDKTYLKFVGNPTDDNYMLRPNSTVEMIAELSTFTDKAGLTADKIIEGNTILGVVGTGTTGVDTSDATATDREIAMGFTAYVNGQKIEGSAFHVDSGETMDYAVNNGITLDDENQRVRLSTRMAMDYLFKTNATLVYIPHYDDLAEAISLTPEKILEGNTILGVVGTAKQEEGTKIYNSVEELPTEATEGQFAIVYRNDLHNATASSQFSKATFPQVVVLPEALTTEPDPSFEAVDNTNQFISLGNVDSTFFSFRYYLNGGSAQVVEYESTDGVTYTKTSGDDVVDFGFNIQYANHVPWNDALGYFFQIGEEVFDGAYRYTNGAWVEMFSSRRYDNTLTPEEYEQAVATATDIQGGNE